MQSVTELPTCASVGEACCYIHLYSSGSWISVPPNVTGNDGGDVAGFGLTGWVVWIAVPRT